MKREILFITLLGIILGLCLYIFNPGKGEGDFLGYWSAAHLFANGGNPYDQTEMSTLEYSVRPERFTENKVLVNTWNPPWLTLILLPLGMLPFIYAVPVWFFCNTLLIGFSLLVSWKIIAGDERSRVILVVFCAGYLFIETISYFGSGQITGLVLLGIILTIWWLIHRMDLLAGMMLLVTTIKPHISYFFIILVLIWVIQNHRWKVIVSFISTASAAMIIFWIFIPSWISDYITLINNLPFGLLYTSTLGSFISSYWGISIFKYSALLLVFCISPFLRLIRDEGWFTATNLALLISLPLSPFGFNFDQIILLPGIVEIIYWSTKHHNRTVNSITIWGSLILVNLFILFMIAMPRLEQFWFFWVPIALLAIFIFSRKNKNASGKFAS